MRRILFCALLTLTCAHPASAQKLPPIYGDGWLGEVVSVNGAAREIVIRAVEKEKGSAETFTGVLEEGYKATRWDGSPYELMLSDLAPGTRLRVFYKTKKKDVGGREVKVHSIFRVHFLGADEHARMREVLSLEPSAPVTPAESEGLPAADPLRVYVASESPFIKNYFAAWAREWNKKQAAKYGSVELVPDRAQSDVSLVVYRGSERMSIPLPMLLNEVGGVPYEVTQSYVTTYLVAGSGGGLRVLWRQVIGNATVGEADSSAVEIRKEFEKRMKARAKAPQK